MKTIKLMMLIAEVVMIARISVVEVLESGDTVKRVHSSITDGEVTNLLELI
jgi:hypothetical protein